jgi:DNA-binding transcriptional MerR regulator
MYSIKAIASLTGLGAETLRAWERRYRTVTPRRDAGGRRYYSQQDLERLLLLAHLSRQGHTISKLTGLCNEELQNLKKNSEEQSVGHPDYVGQIVDALKEYRIDDCELFLKRALMAKEPLPYLRDILIPALQLIGELWRRHKLGIAQEHMFSACVKRILLGMVNNLQSFSANRPGMLFATPSDEPHEFGILMCSLLAAEQDYHCFYLGPNVPAADIIAAAHRLGVDRLVLSLTKFPPDAKTLRELQSAAALAAENNISVWLGGSGVTALQAEKIALPKNCRVLADIDDFYMRAKQWRFGGG